MFTFKICLRTKKMCAARNILVLLVALTSKCSVIEASKNQCTPNINNATGKCGLNAIMINWFERPPYIYSTEDNEMRGILPKVMEAIVAHCCGPCQEIKYETQVQEESQLLALDVNVSHFKMPVIKNMQTFEVAGHPYFPLVESPGILYIIQSKKDLESTVSNALLSSISKAWPIMVFVYLAAAVSGIIVWALDSYWNPYQFPSNFFKGSWDGFWWACVSMTTVGFGDRAPKSCFARLFAFFWILTGLVIIAIFNATITASLTSISMTANSLFSGEEVAVLNDSPEKRFALTKNVQVKGVKSFEEMKELLMNGSESVGGALLDAYVAGYYKNDLNYDHGFRISNVVEHFVAYGIVLSPATVDQDGHNATGNDKGDVVDKKLKQCLLQFTSLYQSTINEIVQQNSNPLEMPKGSISLERSTSLFNTSYTWYIEIVAVCGGIIVLYILYGCLKYLWSKRKSRKVASHMKIEDDVKIPKENSIEELQQRQCKELEQMMEWEVNSFIKNWNKKKMEILTFTCNYSTVTSDLPPYGSMERV